MVTPPDNSSLYKSAASYRKVMAHYDTALQNMDIPYESRYVETRFGATHAVVSGNENGKSVVLWHGGNANAASWVLWITALAPTYHLYAIIDTIGDMGKSAPSRPPKRGPAYGQWAADTLQGLGLKQANMIGISNGGWLILKLGGVAPEMIGSAVLMSSAGFRPMSKMFLLRFMILYVLFRSPAEVARRFLVMLEPPGAPPPGPEALELFALLMGGFRLGQKSPPMVSDAEIRRLAAPTCLMMGQHEVTCDPYKVIERGLSLLPNVISAEVVPEVGHLMDHSQPDWVVARVTGFLEGYAV
jgi:pimeloyl-ACP methyl ester carboxylesterase